MKTNQKRAAALERLAMTGIWRSNYAPPFVRILWWLGIDAPPPHFGNFWSNALGLGSYFAIAFGLTSWFFSWSRRGMSPAVAVISACIFGMLFGLFMAARYNHVRRKHGLPLWRDWNLPPAESAAQLSDYEKERGKPEPSYNHGVVQGRLIETLRPSKEYSILSELTLELPDGGHITPDLSVYPYIQPDWNHDVIRMKQMPLLAVEILTLGQTAQDGLNRIAVYLANGARSVWLVQPEARSISIYAPGNPGPQVFTTGEARDPVTGLTARLEEIFA